ncbi:MAG: YhfC family intramembrane metalloprotease, partial [Bacteroidales bacterium]|nr:YhfC family intramembrane metalloprotease [Bacteroidales bacterium]
MVPAASIVTIAICAILGIGAPILLSWWMVKKYQVKPTTILIGAGVFIVFALVLETILHQVVLKGSIGPTITGNVWYYALYG